MKMKSKERKSWNMSMSLRERRKEVRLKRFKAALLVRLVSGMPSKRDRNLLAKGDEITIN
jgi:hypothetical protein